MERKTAPPLMENSIFFYTSLIVLHCVVLYFIVLYLKNIEYAFFGNVVRGKHTFFGLSQETILRASSGISLREKSCSDMEFVQKFTPLVFQAKNLTPSTSPNFNSFSGK